MENATIGPLAKIRTGVLILVLGLISLATPQAAAQDSGSITVKLLDAVDSAQGSVNQQYKAVVARPTTLGGRPIPKDAPAIVALAQGTGGDAWTLYLVAVSINGQMMQVFGNKPMVVPVSATDFFTMSKKTISTPSRIAIASGENVRFVLGNPAPSGVYAQPAGSTGSPAVAQTQSQPTPAAPQMPVASAAKLLGPAFEPGTIVGEAGDTLHANKFDVRLVGCARQGTASTTCDFVVVNTGDDRSVGIGPGHLFGLVDSKGQVVAFTSREYAGGSRNWSNTLSGLPTKGHFIYNGLDPDVTSLARVEVQLNTLNPNSSAQFEWRNVPLGGDTIAVATTPKVPNDLVYTEDGWRFTVMRCSPMPRDGDPAHKVVECFFKLENLKGDRDIVFDGASLTDPEGRQVDTSWYKAINNASNGFIGDANDYARTVTVPEMNSAHWLQDKTYNAPKISAAVPRYIFAVFSDVDARVDHFVQLRYNIRTSHTDAAGYGRITAIFRNIPLTPMPRPGKTAPSPTSAAESGRPVPVVHGTAAEQAAQAAHFYWDTFLVTCGGIAYTKVPSQGVSQNPEHPSFTLYEFKGEKINTVMRPVSNIDRMNGLEWNGVAQLTYTARREKLLGVPDAKWSEWIPYQQAFAVIDGMSSTISKKKGELYFMNHPFSDLKKEISCKDVQ